MFYITRECEECDSEIVCEECFKIKLTYEYIWEGPSPGDFDLNISEDKFLDEIFKFTEVYPDIKFKIFYTYQENRLMNIYRIKDRDIIKKKQIILI